MKIGIVGAGKVGSACLLSLIMRGVGSEIVVVNRRRERAEGLVTDACYGALLSGPVMLTAGDYCDLAGAQLVMAAARIAEVILRDEKAALPIGAFHELHGVTLSLPAVLGRHGVVTIMEPELTKDEREALDRSAETLQATVSRLNASAK